MASVNDKLGKILNHVTNLLRKVSMRKVLSGAFLFCLSFSLNLRLSFLDPDVHHDGYSLASAIAAQNGLLPNRDYFNQYGPVTSMLHGLWMNLTDTSLLQLRFFTAFLISLNFFLAFLFLLRKYSPLISTFIASAVAISYPFIVPPMLPWPSVLATTISLLVLWSMTRFFLNEKKKSPVLLIFAGLLVGLGFYVRIHMAALLGLIVLALIIRRRYREGVFFAVGFLLFVACVTVFQAFSSSFFPFFEQVILYPFGYYATEGLTPKQAAVNFFLFISFPVFSFLFVSASRLFFNDESPSRHSPKRISIFSFFATCIFSIAFIKGRSLETIPVEYRSFLNIDYLITFYSANFRFFLCFVIAGCFVILALSRKWLMDIFANDVKIIAFAIAIAVMTQLFPSPDVAHLWWIIPVLLSCLVVIIDHPSSINTPIAIFSSLVILINLLQIYEVDQRHRFSYSGSAVAGMKGYVDSLDKNLLAISRLIPPRAGTFHCFHGIFAAPNGRFLSSNSDYLNWGPQSDKKSFKTGFHFYCELNRGWIEPRGQLIWKSIDGDMMVTFQD